MNTLTLPGQVELANDDDICIICLDKMDDNNNTFEHICKTCNKNPIKHTECFDRYKSSNKKRCPLCRAGGFIKTENVVTIIDISEISNHDHTVYFQIIGYRFPRCTKASLIIWGIYIVAMIFFVLFHIFEKTGILGMRNNSTNT